VEDQRWKEQALVHRGTARALAWMCNSGRRVVVTIAVNVALCAGVFAVVEGTGYFDGLYWAVTTASTAGYGDLSPATVPGRITSMWLMFSSVALVAVATARLAARLVQDPHLFSHDEQEELMDDVDDVRAMLALVCERLEIATPDTLDTGANPSASGTTR
jgi:voltage-gated potassium channel